MEKREKRKCDRMRTRFQGITNILRFNWHYYLMASTIVLILFISSFYLGNIVLIPVFLILTTSLVSIFASYYIYDLSDLYQFNWIESRVDKLMILNIHAGFDETSAHILEKYPQSGFHILDFYDPLSHTEISIERARKAYPPFPNTIKTSITKIDFPNNYFDKIFIIFSAHEIRNQEERILFFKELHRVIKINGDIYIVEHLRDLPNFLVYTIGFFHFYSHRTWLTIFKKTNLTLINKEKQTPFITLFTLSKHGNSS
jgi:SAM-dependent methyltransferase